MFVNTCLKCLQEKSVLLFGLRKKREKHIIRPTCKACAARYDARRYELDKPHINAMSRRYHANHADDVHTRKQHHYRTNWAHERSRNDAWWTAHPEARQTDRYKAKQRESSKRWIAKNPEKRRAIDRRYYETRTEQKREYRRRYAKEHPDVLHAANARYRARKRNAPEVEHVNRMVVYRRAHGVCHICKKRVKVTSFTIDHLVPLSENGSHTYTNLDVAHFSCNSRRGNRHRSPTQLKLL